MSLGWPRPVAAALALGISAGSACSGSDSGPASSVAASGAAGDVASGGDDSNPNGTSGGAGGRAVAGSDAGPAGGAIGGGDAADGGDGSAGGSAGDAAAGASATCPVEVAEPPLAVGTHVDTCSNVSYATNPPSSGAHYPVWADFGVYDFPLPRGFWVHNLEHGAVVVAYHCPNGCEDEVSRAVTWLHQLMPDALCPDGPPRVLLVPDPKLDVRWAASAWGFTLRADCFEPAAFSAFYEAHAGGEAAPEAQICETGADLRDPSADTCGAHAP